MQGGSSPRWNDYLHENTLILDNSTQQGDHNSNLICPSIQLQIWNENSVGLDTLIGSVGLDLCHVALLGGSLRTWEKLDSGGELELTLGVVLHQGNVRVGCTVQRGPHWNHGVQDSSDSSSPTPKAGTREVSLRVRNRLSISQRNKKSHKQAQAHGTVLGFRNLEGVDIGICPERTPPGHAVVRWDNGKRAFYPIGGVPADPNAKGDKRNSIRNSIRQNESIVGQIAALAAGQIGVASFSLALVVSPIKLDANGRAIAGVRLTVQEREVMLPQCQHEMKQLCRAEVVL